MDVFPPLTNHCVVALTRTYSCSGLQTSDQRRMSAAETNEERLSDEKKDKPDGAVLRRQTAVIG